MASYLKFTLEDGTIVYIETIEAPKSSSGLLPPTKGEIVADAAPVSFEQSFDAISKMAAVMVKKLQEGFANEPEEMSISFGVKASSDLSNLIVSRGGPDVNYNVSLRWRAEQKKEDKS
jgi:hypothetical protein